MAADSPENKESHGEHDPLTYRLLAQVVGRRSHGDALSHDRRQTGYKY